MTNNHGLDVDYFSRKMERMLNGAASYTRSEWARECARMARVADEAVLQEDEFVGDLRKNAERYMVLRQADVDTIHNGGLFAGLTPDNVVINGSDLDERTDAVIAARKQVTP